MVKGKIFVKYYIKAKLLMFKKFMNKKSFKLFSCLLRINKRIIFLHSPNKFIVNSPHIGGKNTFHTSQLLK